MKIAAKSFLSIVTLALIVAASGQARAVYLVDSGQPLGTTELGVSNSNYGNQFVAQQFTLSSLSYVTTIEAFLAGYSIGSMQMQLSTAIGPTATSANLIATFTLAEPLTNSYVSSNLDAVLAAGTYYLTFSVAPGPYTGALPYGAPSVIGTTYYALAPVDSSLPIASNFNPLSAGYELGVRISGTPLVVPEPPSFALCGVAVVAGLVVARCRRRRGA